MCKDKMAERVRSQDQLGVPVSLSMNGSNMHQTWLGGCCSIISLGLIFFLFVSSMFQVFVNFNYSLMEETTYLRVNDGHEPFKISTEDVIPAIQIVNFSRSNSTLTISDYVVFYQLNNANYEIDGKV